MTAVGLADVFRYGGRFVGYLVAVVVASAVFLGGGAYFAATGGVDIANPSVGALTSARAVGGVVVAAIGAVVALSGLFGLVHKLLADAAMVGLTGSAGPAAQSAVAESPDEEGTDSGETAESGGAPDAPEPAEGESATDRPMKDESHGAEGSSPATTEPEPSRTRTGETPPPAEAESVNDDSPATFEEPPETTDPTASEPTSADAAVPHAESSEASGISLAGESDESDPVSTPTDADGDDWTESEYATGVRAGNEPDQSVADDVGDQQPSGDANRTAPDGPEAADEADADHADDAGRKEWTPPDPAEFERSTGAGGNETVDDATRSETTDMTGGATSQEPHREDTIETPTRDDTTETRDDGTRTGTPDTNAAHADDAFDTTTADDDWNQSTEPTTGTVSDGEEPIDGPEDQAEAGDATLADEGVTSFEVDSDDDPLGDRLAGDDS